MKIGIIGYGNIGQLISKNLINWELINKGDLYVFLIDIQIKKYTLMNILLKTLIK